MANFQPATELFSAGYDLVHNADVQTYDGEEAIMDFEMFEALGREFGDPVVGMVGGLTYYFKPERTIPQATLAVPEHNHDDPNALLIQR